MWGKMRPLTLIARYAPLIFVASANKNCLQDLCIIVQVFKVQRRESWVEGPKPAHCFLQNPSPRRPVFLLLLRHDLQPLFYPFFIALLQQFVQIALITRHLLTSAPKPMNRLSQKSQKRTYSCSQHTEKDESTSKIILTYSQQQLQHNLNLSTIILLISCSLYYYPGFCILIVAERCSRSFYPLSHAPAYESNVLCCYHNRNPLPHFVSLRQRPIHQWRGARSVQRDNSSSLYDKSTLRIVLVQLTTQKRIS